MSNPSINFCHPHLNEDWITWKKQIFLFYAAIQCAWISVPTGILLIQLKTIRKFNGYFVYYLFLFFSSLIQGGRHVDYVVDQVVGKLIEVVKKKNKAGVSVKPFQASSFMQKYWKRWMWEFCGVNGFYVLNRWRTIYGFLLIAWLKTHHLIPRQRKTWHCSLKVLGPSASYLRNFLKQ